MKRILLLCAMLLFYRTAESQIHIGFTESELRSTKPNAEWTKDTLPETKDQKPNIFMYYSDKEDSCLWQYYFNEKITVEFVHMTPHKDKVNRIVKIYNEKLVAVSPTEWRDYQKGHILHVALKYLDYLSAYTFVYWAE